MEGFHMMLAKEIVLGNLRKKAVIAPYMSHVFLFFSILDVTKWNWIHSP